MAKFSRIPSPIVWGRGSARNARDLFYAAHNVFPPAGSQERERIISPYFARSLLLSETTIELANLGILFIVFIATLIRSTFGFGEALVAVPLLAFFIPLEVAAPLAVLVSITIAGIVVVQDWKKIHLRSTGWLVLSTLFGIPLGLLLLTSSHHRLVKGALGVIIATFSVYSLIGRAPLELKRDSRGWLLACGFCAGVLGGAYGMNGPPLAVYGAMRRWSAQHFRATLQGYFLPASIIGMAGYWLAGLWVPTVTHYYLLSLPATILAVFLGRAINHRLHGDSFMKYIYLSLAGIGVVLSIQAITGRL
ncbi:MAG: sulfite exporter TauE/SafE family protein [Candidatus Sulfotelmatobacter sp.]